MTPLENPKAAYAVFVGQHHTVNPFLQRVLNAQNEQATAIGSRVSGPAYLEEFFSHLLLQYAHSKAENRQVPAELEEALQDLKEVKVDAKEDGLEVPSELAFTNAERLLKTMYRISPRRYGVYPAPDGYIAIDARGANGRIAVTMCGSDGGALCLVTIDNEQRRARYDTARQLPDGFIREALHELGAEPA
ncbi:MAG: hypothetical protein OXE17_16235 [Chloroflexi bacterium]|nr:hypothetical protein [Chloroflexota bacterium]